MRWVFALLLVAVLARAEDDDIVVDEGPRSQDPVVIATEEATDEILRSPDAKTFRTALRGIKAWRVADELCRRGEFDVAERFAGAMEGADNAKLPA